jgi:UDP-N-acetylmuramoyl-L-alanyl-D-glutamate--2,6-diaminopimelate ligase
MTRNLSDLVGKTAVVNRHGLADTQVTGLSFDAFTVKPGELFFAVEGVNSDRHQYITEVVGRGITAVVHSRPLGRYRDDVAYLQVADVQKSMSPISSAYYGEPSKRLRVIGVTGTNGKSTTASFIYQLINSLERRAAILSSVYYDLGAGLVRNPLHSSTPEAPVVQECLYNAAENGLRYMVLEATSHGLSERNNRVGDVHFDVAVMTNVSHEHLEFHGTMEQYVHDKANLFRLMDRLSDDAGFGVVNGDDPLSAEFAAATNKPVLTYGIEEAADARASDIQSGPASSTFILEWQGASQRVILPVPGGFNISNALAALLVVSRTLDLPLWDVAAHLSELRTLTGRMTPVEGGQPFTVIVDFAHTPDSFEKLLPEVKNNTRRRLIVVFGSAGERDTAKRPLQGKIASLYSDVVILADEDPRGEDPKRILDDIAAGCEGLAGDELLLIPDRRRAVKKAISIARAGDTVLLLGKGHETTIAYEAGDILWDEEQVARKCLSEAGF